jgi:hypothetical protein
MSFKIKSIQQFLLAITKSNKNNIPALLPQNLSVFIRQIYCAGITGCTTKLDFSLISFINKKHDNKSRNYIEFFYVVSNLDNFGRLKTRLKITK